MNTPSAWGLPMMESWYMDRGKSNLEIGNYKAAIEAYEKVVGQNPENKEAMRSLGLAYEKQGLKDKAVEQYDKYLAKNSDDSEIAFHQAEVLGWSRYSYRKSDALKYYKMGLSKKNSTPMRLKYARLLASNQGSTPEAIHQYQIVLKSQPHNAEAHGGLAKAYAWNGKNDLALYHAGLAERYGASTSDLHSLEHDLNQGREPSVSGDFTFLNQVGNSYGLTGFQLSTLGKKDLSPFLTGSARAGYENYWSGTSNVPGAFFSLGMEYRIDESSKISGDLGYHTFQPITSAQTRNTTNAGANNAVFKLEYQTQSTGMSIRSGFERSLRTDSLLSLVGSRLNGTGLGAARSHLFYTVFQGELASFNFEARPYAGWITALTVPANTLVGADLSVKHALMNEGAFSLSLGHFMQVAHYGSDQSSSTGNGAGYYSPQLYMNQNPRLMVKVNFSDQQSLEVCGGPAFQFVNDRNVPGNWQMGGNGHVGYLTQLSKRFYWNLGADYLNLASAYSRIQVQNVLTYTF
jgi:tetratricopeptide (TPR) repeat protein